MHNSEFDGCSRSTLIVIDLHDFPEVTGFSSLWVSGVWPDLQMLVEAPEKWTVGPKIIAYYSGCDHELKDGRDRTPHGRRLASSMADTEGREFYFFLLPGR